MNQSSKSSSNSSTGGKSGGVGSFTFGGSFVPPSSPTTSTTTTTTTFPRLTLGGEFNMVPASSSKETISGTTVSNTWFGSSESKNTNGFTTTRSSFEMTTPTTTSRSNTTGGEEPSSSNSTSFGFTPFKPHHSVRNLSEDKVYFVNCDPVVFEHIVRWLRYGIVSSEFNESLLVELKTACREYHLTNLEKEIERIESKKREKLTQIQFLKILNTNSSKLSNKMISLNLSGLDMTRLRICNVNMSSSDIFDSDMSKCILTNVNLSGSNLSETHFNEASFEKVNFSKCNLTNCNFDIVTKMEDCDFSDATGMDSFWNALLDIIVKACKLSNTTCVISHHKYLVTSKRYEKSCFTNVDFKDIPGKLQECTLDNCKFEFERQPKTSLTGSKFQKIDFSKCTFSDCKFKNIQWNKNDVLANSFARCEFSECNFRNADLRDEVFSQCTFTNCQFWNCLMTTWLYQKISPSSRVQTDPVLPFGKQTTKRPFVVKVTSPNSVQELSREEIEEWEKSTNLRDDTFYDSFEELSQEEIEE